MMIQQQQRSIIGARRHDLRRQSTRWALMLCLATIQQTLLVGPQPSEALRTGAPAMSCLSMRPLHGLNRPKPASASQFFIRQSVLGYLPGESIVVELMTYSDSRHFRGFLVQAFDPHTGHHIGTFAPTKESRPIDACSAATHRDNYEKQHVKLVWLSPGAILPPGTDLGAPSASSSSGWRNPIQPSVNFSLLHKRQLVSVTTNVTNITNNQTDPVDQRAPGGGPSQDTPFLPFAQSSPAPLFPPVKRQVRFRATVVVAYDDFYMGFESSDLSYDAFSFANGTST